MGKAEIEARSRAVMRVVINLAKELDLRIIAEGVETEEQAGLLKSMGCGLAHGYPYGRPMPEAEFAKRPSPQPV